MAIGTIIGTIPYLVLAIYKDTMRKGVSDQAVDTAEGGSPTLLLAVETCQTCGRGKIDVGVVLRESQLDDIVARWTVCLRIVIAVGYHLIVLDGSIRTDAEHTFAQSRQPNIAPLVAFDVIDACVLDGFDVEWVVVAVGIQRTCSIGIGGYPDASFRVLAHAEHDSPWYIVPQQVLAIGSEFVDAVLVGANPEVVLLVKHHARYTVVADEIEHSQAISHIAEVVGTEWLHEYAFLQHGEPNVALLVLDDAPHLAFRQVGLWTKEEIVISHVGGRVVERDAFAIAADKQAVVPIDEDSAGGKVGNGCYLGEDAETRSEAIDTLALGSEVEDALAVLLDVDGFQVGCPEGMANELTFLVEQEKLVAIGD